MTGRTSRVLTYGANALLLLSLFLPTALETARPNEVVYGYHIVMIGFLGPVIWQFGWFGNLAVPIAGLSRSRGPRLVAALAFFNSMFWTYIVDDVAERPITHLAGYYVWMAAMLLSALPLLWLGKRSLVDRSARS